MGERANLILLDLRGNPATAEFTAGAQAVLGCPLPLAPNTCAHGPHCDILWLGPDEWLVVSTHAQAINADLPIVRGCLTDVSHGRMALRISGPRTREMLARGCSLDLDPRAFLPGHCAQTSLAHVNVLLHLPRAGDEFELYCARSYAQHLWHSLTAAAAGFCYEVVPPSA